MPPPVPVSPPSVVDDGELKRKILALERDVKFVRDTLMTVW